MMDRNTSKRELLSQDVMEVFYILIIHMRLPQLMAWCPVPEGSIYSKHTICKVGISAN